MFSSVQISVQTQSSNNFPISQLKLTQESPFEKISSGSQVDTVDELLEPVDFASVDKLFTYFLTKKICQVDGRILDGRKTTSYALDEKSYSGFCELFKQDLKKRWRIVLKEAKETEEMSLEEIIGILKTDSDLTIRCWHAGSRALEHLAEFFPQLAQDLFDVPKEDIQKLFKLSSRRSVKNRDRDIQIHTKDEKLNREKLLKDKPWLNEANNELNLAKELSSAWKVSKMLSSILGKAGKAMPDNFALKGIKSLPNEKGEIHNALFSIQTTDFNEIDFFVLYEDEVTRKCFSSKSCCKIEINPRSLNSFILSADPFTLEQFILDALIDNISIDVKNLDEKNLLEIIRAISLNGSRLLRKGDIEKVVAAFVSCLKNKKDSLFSQHLQEGFKECIKHEPKDPEAALLMLFTTCQLLHSYAPIDKEIAEATAKLIIKTEEDKLLGINESKQSPFAWLKQLLVTDKRPFSQVATALQIVAPQLFPQFLVNHNGGLAYRIPMPRMVEGKEQILYLFIPMLAAHHYENLDENSAELCLLVYKQLSKMFPPKITDFNSIKAYSSLAEERAHIACNWMQSDHSTTCLMGIQLLLTCPDKFFTKKTLVLLFRALPIGLEFNAFKMLKDDDSKRILALLSQLDQRIKRCSEDSDLLKPIVLLSSSIAQNSQALALSRWILMLSTSQDVGLSQVAYDLFWQYKGNISQQEVLEIAKIYIKYGTHVQIEKMLKDQCEGIFKTDKEEIEFFNYVCTTWSKSPTPLERQNALFLLSSLAEKLLKQKPVTDIKNKPPIKIPSKKQSNQKSLPIQSKQTEILKPSSALPSQQLVENFIWLTVNLYGSGHIEIGTKLLQTLSEYKTNGAWENIWLSALRAANEQNTTPLLLVNILSQLIQSGCLNGNDEKVQKSKALLILKLKTVGDSESSKLADQMRHELIIQNIALLNQKEFAFLIDGWLDDNLKEPMPAAIVIRHLQTRLTEQKYRSEALQLLKRVVNLDSKTIPLECSNALDVLFVKLCECDWKQNVREELIKHLFDYLFTKIEQDPDWDPIQYSKFTHFCYDFLPSNVEQQQKLMYFLCITQEAVKRPTAKMLRWLMSLPLSNDLACSLILDSIKHGNQEELKQCKQIFIQHINKYLQSTSTNRFERVEVLLRQSCNEKTIIINLQKESIFGKSQFAMTSKEHAGLWCNYLTSYLQSLSSVKTSPEELNLKLIPFIKYGIEVLLDPTATQKCLSSLFDFLGAHFKENPSQRKQVTSLAGMLAYLTAPHQVYRLLCKQSSDFDVEIKEHYQLNSDNLAISNFYTWMVQGVAKLNLSPQVISEELSDFVDIFFDNKLELKKEDLAALLYEYAFSFTPEIDIDLKENKVEFNHYQFGRILYEIALKQGFLDNNPLQKLQLMLYYKDVAFGADLDGELIVKIASQCKLVSALEPLYNHLLSSKKSMPFAVLKAISVFELLYPQIITLEKNPSKAIEKTAILYQPLLAKCAQTPFYLNNGVTLTQALFKPILTMPTGQNAAAFYDIHVMLLRYQLEHSLRILDMKMMSHVKNFTCEYALHALRLIDSLSGLGVSPGASKTETLGIIEKLLTIVKEGFDEKEITDTSFIYAVGVLEATTELALIKATESERKRGKEIKNKLTLELKEN